MTVTPLSRKGKSTIYTDKKRAALLYNAKHDKYVKETAEKYREEADMYLDKADTIYDLIVAEGLFRYYFVGDGGDPHRMECRYCHGDIAKHANMYGWKTDPFNAPWKVECPICGRKFPSNDFESYYKLGLTRDGRFDPEKAKREHIKLFGSLDNMGYLKNELYPEMDEHIDENGNLVNEGVHGWGVDDGFGYVTVSDTGRPERHSYIAFYLHTGVWGGTGKNINAVRTPLKAFKNAYLYTGEKKYAIAGAKLLDRVADFYPDFDWYRWHDLRGREDYHGKILDPIWECWLAAEFAESYDAFFPVYDDKELIEFLSAKAKKYGTDHINPKNTGDHLRKNAEDGILRATFKGALYGKIQGNFGMDQSTVVTAAVVLNTMPETGEWLDWVMAPGGTSGRGDYTPRRAGGNVMAQLVGVVDHDGFGDECAAGYNGLWRDALLDAANTLLGYELYPVADLFKNPKFLKMFYADIFMTMGGYYTAQIGDAGAFAGTGIYTGIPTTTAGYIATKDPFFAQILYFINGRSAKGLRYPDTFKDPSSLEKEVEETVAKYGELDLPSTMQTGYGLAALRDGGIGRGPIRDMWLYFGANYGHGHKDSLNLGMTFHGLNMAPDLGYPKDTGTNANRVQWIATTLSHTTTMVDEKAQIHTQNRGTPFHFDDSGNVKLVDVDRKAAYPHTDAYRRSVIMIRVDENESYGVDFFRICGGHDHLYSFHSQSKEISKTEGLDLVSQIGGSYASPDVPWGDDPGPKSNTTGWSNVYDYPDGYTWLENVEKDLSPEKDVMIEFKITDFKKRLEDSEGIYLRMHMLSNEPLNEVSIADGYPVANSVNPQTNIKYVLARRKALSESEKLDTLFTTVFEPYKLTRYLTKVSLADIKRADGKEFAENEKAAALKVTHANGREDIIMFSYDNKTEYIVDGRYSFRGFTAVIFRKNDKVIYSYINDGDKLCDNINGASLISEKIISAYTGTVLDFEKSLSLKNFIEVTFDKNDVTPDLLKGRHIYVDNDGVRSAVYEIKGAEKTESGSFILDLGDITLVRTYKNNSAPEEGFIYNVSEGQSFRIPLSFSKA